MLEAITAALNEKYPNRVVPQLGLCIALYDIVAVGEAQIHPGSAAHHTHVEFRLVVFRPFVGEVLEGTIIGCDEAGLRVSMGFFDNIHVPRHLIGFAQGAVRWSPDEQLWFWQIRRGVAALVRHGRPAPQGEPRALPAVCMRSPTPRR